MKGYMVLFIKPKPTPRLMTNTLTVRLPNNLLWNLKM